VGIVEKLRLLKIYFRRLNYCKCYISVQLVIILIIIIIERVC